MSGVTKVYSTLSEKVAAYEDFFESDETQTLVVIGPGGSGKSLALNRVERHGELVIHADSYPQFREPMGIAEDESGSSPITLSRTVYHLFDTDEDLAELLKRKYGARVIRFERGTEGLEPKKEYVDFMDAIEMFYVCFRDDREQRRNNRIEVEEIRKSVALLLKELDEVPRV